jgi:hypothetical protein
MMSKQFGSADCIHAVWNLGYVQVGKSDAFLKSVGELPDLFGICRCPTSVNRARRAKAPKVRVPGVKLGQWPAGSEEVDGHLKFVCKAFQYVRPRLSYARLVLADQRS